MVDKIKVKQANVELYGGKTMQSLTPERQKVLERLRKRHQQILEQQQQHDKMPKHAVPLKEVKKEIDATKNLAECDAVARKYGLLDLRTPRVAELVSVKEEQEQHPKQEGEKNEKQDEKEEEEQRIIYEPHLPHLQRMYRKCLQALEVIDVFGLEPDVEADAFKRVLEKSTRLKMASGYLETGKRRRLSSD